MKVVSGVVYVSAEEMHQVDEEAIAEYDIDVLSLMENAGAATANLVRRMIGSPGGRRVACLVGKGNNGGDGLVAARHIHNWGAEVSVMLGSSRDDLGEIAANQLRAVEKMGIPVGEGWRGLDRADLLVDALLGYNAKGDPREPVAGLIREANSSGVPILGLDIPSGLDPTTGTPNEPCIVAKATLTLGLPKTGFLNPASRHYVGELYLGDISIPLEVYRKHSQAAALFGRDVIVSLRPP